mmetsp:Transcript_11559/g.15630  ORF Transcript_11559/g.15630 Transcript_11559/m.15630 type:complete len:82 (+) Transcript_11559:917-1162(+)|eukprot:CAMPEP_0170458482 /NCGR_PEP_ID=MMETSP0123-20130129/5438_1 /TAXON_ID=182087 /ORGANISM="Favella ehrenbergii, Strain Fehren 1" /LENGTH=81 /DNA_ID=CAMNT_0010722647 /DNA_START=680 /DNA_END=925 /DNA_ORIENTATION=-
MAQEHNFREFLKTLIARGERKDYLANKGARSLSRKRVEAEVIRQQAYSMTIIGIANSVELFKGEVGKGGSMQAMRKSLVAL